MPRTQPASFDAFSALGASITAHLVARYNNAPDADALGVEALNLDLRTAGSPFARCAVRFMAEGMAGMMCGRSNPYHPGTMANERYAMGASAVVEGQGWNVLAGLVA